MKREITRMMRVPSLVRTKNGHAVNKWCGSCQHKEVQAVSSGSGESKRFCKSWESSWRRMTSVWTGS